LINLGRLQKVWGVRLTNKLRLLDSIVAEVGDTVKEEDIWVKKCFTHPPFTTPPQTKTTTPPNQTKPVVGCFMNLCFLFINLTCLG
jgi:hypothetical protein